MYVLQSDRIDDWRRQKQASREVGRKRGNSVRKGERSSDHEIRPRYELVSCVQYGILQHSNPSMYSATTLKTFLRGTGAPLAELVVAVDEVFTTGFEFAERHFSNQSF